MTPLFTYPLLIAFTCTSSMGLSTTVSPTISPQNTPSIAPAVSPSSTVPELTDNTALSIKYDSCRRVRSVTIDGEVTERTGCLEKFECTDIDDANLRNVDGDTFNIENEGGVIPIIQQSSEYDPNVVCLYDSLNYRVLHNDHLYVHEFTEVDNELCGCIWEESTMTCWECIVYFCTESQPDTCYDGDVIEEQEDNNIEGQDEIIWILIMGAILAVFIAIVIVTIVLVYYARQRKKDPVPSANAQYETVAGDDRQTRQNAEDADREWSPSVSV